MYCDILDDVPEVGPVDVDGDIGVLLVERRAFLVDVAEGLAFGDDDAAGLEVPDALFDGFEGRLQVDDGADLLEVGHGAGAVDRGAAGRDDRALRNERRVDGVFEGGKGVGAHVVDHVLELAAGLFLDDEVGVEEPVCQVLGEQDTDGAFAAAGHTDEDDVLCIHEVFPPVHWKCVISLSKDDSLVKLQIFSGDDAIILALK